MEQEVEAHSPAPQRLTLASPSDTRPVHDTGRVSFRLVALATCALALLAGCGFRHHRVVVTHTLPPVIETTSPQPARTVIHEFRTYRAGQTATLAAQRGVSLRLGVGKPSTSTTRLSSSYGYAPQHGHYVTFLISVTNTGSESIEISPRNFVVEIHGQGVVTSYDGNSPYSGASRQLDTTELEPGEHVSAPLTFDVRQTHGRLDFRPGRATAAAWTF